MPVPLNKREIHRCDRVCVWAERARALPPCLELLPASRGYGYVVALKRRLTDDLENLRDFIHASRACPSSKVLLFTFFVEGQKRVVPFLKGNVNGGVGESVYLLIRCVAYQQSCVQKKHGTERLAWFEYMLRFINDNQRCRQRLRKQVLVERVQNLRDLAACAWVCWHGVFESERVA